MGGCEERFSIKAKRISLDLLTIQNQADPGRPREVEHHEVISLAFPMCAALGRGDRKSMIRSWKSQDLAGRFRRSRSTGRIQSSRHPARGIDVDQGRSSLHPGQCILSLVDEVVLVNLKS